MTRYNTLYNKIFQMCEQKISQFEQMTPNEMEKWLKLNKASKLNTRNVSRLDGVSVLLLQESINEEHIVTKDGFIIKPAKKFNGNFVVKPVYKNMLNFGGSAPPMNYTNVCNQYFSEKIERIKSFKTQNSFTFVSITDVHSSDNDYDDGLVMDNHIGLAKEVAKQVGADLIIDTGDMINGLDETKEQSLAVINRVYNLTVDDLEIPYIVTMGNHDNNYQFSRYRDNNSYSGYITKEEFYEATNKKSYDVGKINSLSQDASSKGVFYLDSLKNKTRFIFFNVVDGVFRNNNGKFEGTYDKFEVSHEQMEHIKRTFETTPLGYSIVACTHYFSSSNPQYFVLTALFDSCNRGVSTTIDSTYDNVTRSFTFDFTGNQRDINFIMTGHTHNDYTYTCCNNTKPIRVFSSTSCSPFTSIDYEYKPERPKGTRDEYSFNVVTINRDTGMAEFTRIGYGRDRRLNLSNGDFYYV